METYEQFGRFYDAVMGDRTQTAMYLRSLIARHHPAAKTLLELACGTGSLLKLFTADYEVSGLDASPTMLALARKKLLRVPLVCANHESEGRRRRYRQLEYQGICTSTERAVQTV